MSGLLALFYWVAIPTFAVVVGGKIIAATWSKTTSRAARIAIVFSALVGSLGLIWVLGGGQKWSIDAEVERLCAIDGGTRVFEQVVLPPSEFNEFGDPKFWYGNHNSTSQISADTTTIERPLGPEHIWKWEVKYLKRENPSLTRDQFNIIRRADGRNMGESVSYSRVGGDLPGPWHPSSFRCPANSPSFLRTVFVQAGAARANPAVQGTPPGKAAQRP